MRNFCLSFLALLLGAIPIQAQTDTLRLVYSVQGIVTDTDNGRAIEAALVTIPEQSVSTVSNADGKFIIKSAEPINSVQVSCLGYMSITCPVRQGRPLIIKLKPISFTLDVATVISGDPLEIVKAAIGKIPDNYCNRPELLECFYRETIRKRSRYTYISEAVARMYKTGYGKDVANDRTALEKSRVLLSQKRSDTLSVKVQGGPSQAAVLDIVKNRDLLFNQESLTKYIFEMAPPVYIDGRLQFVIHFRPGDTFSDDALYYGTMYIDCAKLFFSRIEMSLDVSDTFKAVRLLVVRKPMSLRLTPRELSIQANYSYDGDIARLSYLRTTYKFNCDWKKRLLATSYTAVNELVVTGIYPEAIPIGRSEMFRTDDILSDKAELFQDADFWKDYNIIEPAESLEQAVKRLRKGR